MHSWDSHAWWTSREVVLGLVSRPKLFYSKKNWIQKLLWILEQIFLEQKSIIIGCREIQKKTFRKSKKIHFENPKKSFWKSKIKILKIQKNLFENPKWLLLRLVLKKPLMWSICSNWCESTSSPIFKRFNSVCWSSSMWNKIFLALKVYFENWRYSKVYTTSYNFIMLIIIRIPT